MQLIISEEEYRKLTNRAATEASLREEFEARYQKDMEDFISRVTDIYNRLQKEAGRDGMVSERLLLDAAARATKSAMDVFQERAKLPLPISPPKI